MTMTHNAEEETSQKGNEKRTREKKTRPDYMGQDAYEWRT